MAVLNFQGLAMQLAQVMNSSLRSAAQLRDGSP